VRWAKRKNPLLSLGRCFGLSSKSERRTNLFRSLCASFCSRSGSNSRKHGTQSLRDLRPDRSGNLSPFRNLRAFATPGHEPEVANKSSHEIVEAEQWSALPDSPYTPSERGDGHPRRFVFPKHLIKPLILEIFDFRLCQAHCGFLQKQENCNNGVNCRRDDNGFESTPRTRDKRPDCLNQANPDRSTSTRVITQEDHGYMYGLSETWIFLQYNWLRAHSNRRSVSSMLLRKAPIPSASARSSFRSWTT
jgi:hypothetical protein